MVAPASASSSTSKQDRAAAAAARTAPSAATAGAAQAPVALADGVRVATDGAAITVHTGTTRSSARATVGDRAVYAGTEKQTSTVVQRSADGTQIIKVIEGAEAPNSYSFRLDLPEGARLAPTSAGGVVIERGGTVVGYVEAPWAVDATGAKIATAYRVEGNTIVQTVAHKGAKYPVVADPSVSLGRYWYVRYNKSEVQRSANAAFASGNAAAITLLCGLLTAVNVALGAVCGAALAGVATSVIGQVKDAAREGKCILHRYTITPVVLVAWEKYSC